VSIERPVPVYRQVAEQMATSIRQGEWVPGQRIPTVDEIANRFDVARATAQRAVDQLRAGGYVERVGRSSFFGSRVAARDKWGPRSGGGR
jgi:DNA-binding GntR family transcriptional regulator